MYANKNRTENIMYTNKNRTENNFVCLLSTCGTFEEISFSSQSLRQVLLRCHYASCRSSLFSFNCSKMRNIQYRIYPWQYLTKSIFYFQKAYDNKSNKRGYIQNIKLIFQFFEVFACADRMRTTQNRKIRPGDGWLESS